jgi:hypothetical protein
MLAVAFAYKLLDRNGSSRWDLSAPDLRELTELVTGPWLLSHVALSLLPVPDGYQRQQSPLIQVKDPRAQIVEFNVTPRCSFQDLSISDVVEEAELLFATSVKLSPPKTPKSRSHFSPFFF